MQTQHQQPIYAGSHLFYKCNNPGYGNILWYTNSWNKTTDFMLYCYWLRHLIQQLIMLKLRRFTEISSNCINILSTVRQIWWNLTWQVHLISAVSATNLYNTFQYYIICSYLQRSSKQRHRAALVYCLRWWTITQMSRIQFLLEISVSLTSNGNRPKFLQCLKKVASCRQASLSPQMREWTVLEVIFFVY